jgi:hypothetical protein
MSGCVRWGAHISVAVTKIGSVGLRTYHIVPSSTYMQPSSTGVTIIEQALRASRLLLREQMEVATSLVSFTSHFAAAAALAELVGPARQNVQTFLICGSGVDMFCLHLLPTWLLDF